MEMPKEMETNKSEDKSSLLGKTVVVEDKNMKAEIVHHEDSTSMEISKSSSAMDTIVQGGESYRLKPLSSTRRDGHLTKHEQQEDDDELQSAKVELGEVREENERLKLLLARIVQDYQSLQMHFVDVLRKEEAAKKSTDANSEEADELVSLSLGRTSTCTSDHIKKTSNSSTSNRKDDVDDHDGAGLSLELGCKFEPAADQSKEVVMKNSSSDNSLWPPSKALKTARSSGDDELAQQTHLKKARVSIRARCDAPTMHDGCQWRKYGQKIAKGNPWPRAYYRCTVSTSCPVRKQVQRSAEDTSILITTYEGNHNHPLPISATAMASATSAAASMLQSHSSTSQQGLVNPTTAATISSFQNSRPPQQNFYFTNSSISTNNSHPTITLDLTAPSPSHFGRFPNPRYSSSTCLNFSSPPYNNIHDTPSYFNYGTMLQSQNRLNQTGSSLHNIGKQPIFYDPNLYQSYMQNQIKAPPHHHQQQQLLTETIATATKAITSNPKFQSALAAALTSFVGNGVGENHQSGSSTTESTTTTTSGMKLKWGESLASNSIYPHQAKVE